MISFMYYSHVVFNLLARVCLPVVLSPCISLLFYAVSTPLVSKEVFFLYVHKLSRGCLNILRCLCCVKDKQEGADFDS